MPAEIADERGWRSLGLALMGKFLYDAFLCEWLFSSAGRHSQVAKAVVCKTTIPGSNPGAASSDFRFWERRESYKPKSQI